LIVPPLARASARRRSIGYCCVAKRRLREMRRLMIV